MEKILIIRFSSIGDIIQCMSVIKNLKQKYPNSEIHWIARKDMAPLLKIDQQIDKIWEFDRKEGIKGLVAIAKLLKKENFTHVYDAHSNIRSNILKLFICPFNFCKLSNKPQLVTRHKDRLKRLLLFKFRINLFPKPFRSFESFSNPLRNFKVLTSTNTSEKVNFKYTFPDEIEKKIKELVLNKFSNRKWICLVPSAAWELKRWPINYWCDVVKLLPNYNFVVLGGPADAFCEEVKNTAPERVINLAGKTSLLESFCTIYHSPYVISGDTGFLHAADLFSKPGQAIIGPTAFGFPTGEKIKIMEIDLPCRPCTKDGSTKCRISDKRKCLLDISPEMVANACSYPTH